MTPQVGDPTPGPGHRPSTTRGEIAAVALRLFAERGFEQTTLDDIAAAIGVGRRTLFRYFPSKNDMGRGDFDGEIARLRQHLDATGPEVPLMRAIRLAVVATNDVREADISELRSRMKVLTQEPALQAHSAIRYRDWREAVAGFSAQRLGRDPADLIPQAIGHATLGVTLASFLSWVRQPPGDLAPHLDRALRLLEVGFDEATHG